MTLPVENIISFIPQKPPFVMVSKLLFTDEVSTRSSFLITGDNVFVKDSVFQEAGLLENMAQTAALRAGYIANEGKNPVATGYIATVKDFEIYSLPKVNDELTTEITIENEIFDVTVFSGKVWHNKDLIAKCSMTVFKGNKE
jgi:predicted hotdog family 3-hydroxylacyl-ACP dehydratase